MAKHLCTLPVLLALAKSSDQKEKFSWSCLFNQLMWLLMASTTWNFVVPEMGFLIIFL